MSVIKEVSLVNEFGEKMTLRLDNDNEIWFHHEDCNDDYEKLNDLWVTYKIKGKTINGMKYVLDKMEKSVLNDFIDGCLINGFVIREKDIPVMEFK